LLHWKPEQIKKLQIPILSKPVQQKITDLVHQSHEARNKARQMLKEANLKVDEAINKG